MYEFEYHKATSVDDAVAAQKKGDDARFLAGGHTLLPTMKQRLASPSDLVDISGISGLGGITVSGDTVTIGATTTHGEVADSADVKNAIPALAAMAGGIGDPQVRSCGTIGGSLANNDPAADYPAAVLALGATIVTNEREIAGDDFFVGLFETALNDGELITAVKFPVPAKAGYSKFPNPASRYAVVGVMYAETSGGIRVGVTGAGPCAFRASDIEAALSSGGDIPASSAANLNSDIHASADYRAHLIGVMTKRAVEAAG
jgi:carbon-monoxide dehydrogenase medium subunit